jgi:hypothetical protein
MPVNCGIGREDFPRPSERSAGCAGADYVPFPPGCAAFPAGSKPVRKGILKLFPRQKSSDGKWIGSAQARRGNGSIAKKRSPPGLFGASSGPVKHCLNLHRSEQRIERRRPAERR